MKKRTLLTGIAIMLTAAFLGGCASGTAAESGTDKKAETAVETEAAGTADEVGAVEDTTSAEKDAAGETSAAADGIFGSFTSVTQDGDEVTEEIFTLADLTMVNIWGTFCSPCIKEMPELGELAEEYADQSFQIVGIISDVYEPGNGTAQDIITATGADYTHMVLSQELYDNFLWQVQSVPTTIFVDKNGQRVGKAVVGARDKEAWTTIIEERLEELKNGATADENE